MQLLMPFVFVLLWSAGFIAGKYSMPYAEPMTVLFMRYGGVVVCMLPLMALWHAPWPRRGAQPVVDAGAGASAMPGALDWRVIGHIAVAGLLMQAGYLGGVWSAARGAAGGSVGADCRAAAHPHGGVQ